MWEAGDFFTLYWKERLNCAKIGETWPNQAFEKGVESPKMFVSNVGAKCCKQHAGS